MADQTRAPGRRLLREIFCQRRRVLVTGLLCGLAGQLGYLATPALVQRAVDDGLDAGAAGRTAGWALAVVGLALLVLVGGTLGERLTRHAANVTALDLRERLLDRAGAADGAVTARFERGDLASRAERDVLTVADWVDKLTYWTLSLSTIVVVVPAIATLHPRLLVVTAAMAPLVVATQLIFPPRFAAAAEKLAGAHARRAGAVEELLSAAGAVRGLGGTGRLVRRHADASGEVTVHTLTVARVAAWWASVPPSVPRLAIAAGLATGGLAVLDGGLSIGGLIAYTSWMTMLTIALSFLVLLVSNRREAEVSGTRIAAVLDTPSPRGPAGAAILPERGDLVLDELSARTGSGGEPTEPLRLTAAPGELVVLRGPVGSGKSSLLRAVARLDDPAAGTVRFGGADVARADRMDWWARIGYVPQRPLVLTGTIADNVRLGRAAGDDEVAWACRVAGADGFVRALPAGYETAVGERGTTLSGGQVQRLALARALLGRPRVLLLDDVTSAVDVGTERAILDRLRTELPDTAIVAVSHRTQFRDRADRVVDLQAPITVGSIDG
ncbi:ABC transporter ATP-binding protein [Jiangella alkaliphila]|uniref:ABC-type multidrug transport system, ATPase and permease component n=1 Tax=Jiangella alkaliphila TaxID=419479 RepID=A0A1H2KXQ7_9ACTN|nr:ABC transporter ATP-binding protein [Jiangella alkaliphila]SDU73513.1 ABC-type multidrug transport system, ATPase and permease component [Jiangella alkaliphila]